jgi:hypothetical protein|tara:strand:+ start:149 stop:751 length:603 start_codon:yes stop_codon:yes gene_type:complete
MDDQEFMKRQLQNQQQQTDIGFIPQGDEGQNVWVEHLDTTDILTFIEKMLKGYELNEQTEEWEPAKILVADEEGKHHEVFEGPLMEPNEIRVTITWLRTYLNSNTYLSKIKEDMTNNIMFDANIKLATLFYKLRHKITPEIRGLLWNMIENTVYIGLSRAGEGRKGMTLGAVSDAHHTIEHLQNNPIKPPEPKKFKMFGF